MKKSGRQNDVSVAARAESDTRSEVDSCGFRPYVEALARFLTDPNTRGPLTVSVEGEWGSGKSSFMVQLQRLLESEHRASCVWFNAWRSHDATDLIPAFSRAFLRDLKRGLPPWRRYLAALNLFFSRYSWERGGFAYFVRSCLIVLVYASLAVGAGVAIAMKGGHVLTDVAGRLGDLLEKSGKGNIKEPLAWLLGSGSAAAILCSFLALWKGLKPLIGSPFEIKLSKYSRAPSFSNRYSLVEEFESDFAHIVQAFAFGRRIFCFIDDIDRCDQTAIVQLINGLNLIIVENVDVMFVVGMDSEKVALALASRFEGVLPYMRIGERTADVAASLPGRIARARAVAFGRDFLEKFIQIPFKVPVPDERIIAAFVKSLTSGAATEARRRSPADKSRRDRISVKVGNDSDQLRRVCSEYAVFLGNNPRRVKRFLNILRLEFYIGHEIGLFDATANQPPLTIEQFGKALVILMRWPEVIADGSDDFRLLRSLQEFSLGDETNLDEDIAEEVRALARDTRLKDLLVYGLDPKRWLEELGASPYSLANANLQKLLIASNRVRMIGGQSGFIRERLTPKRDARLKRGFVAAPRGEGAEAKSEIGELDSSPDLTRDVMK